MGTTTGLGLGLVRASSWRSTMFLLNGWYVDVGEWAGELADWFMNRDE